MLAPRVFLTHETASAYWLHRDLLETTSTRSAPTKTDTPSRLQILDTRRLVMGLDENAIVHVSVCGREAVHAVEGVSLRRRTGSYPEGSFRRINRDTFVASPELCFLQAATVLSFNKLVLYGFELCGTYARLGGETSARYKRERLTSARKIAAYLDRSQGITGIKQAQRACSYLIDGSASPRESMLAAMLTLRPRLGGFGLPKPQMNYGIEVNAPDKLNPGSNLVLHGDMVWPDAKLIVEYDGAQHGEDENHASDKQRDHLLLDAGFEVVRVTDRQLHDAREIERLARTIAKKAGLRRPETSLRTNGAKLATQHELLFESDPSWLSGLTKSR